MTRPTTETLRLMEPARTPRRGQPRLRLLYTPGEGIVASRVFTLPIGVTWVGRELPRAREGIGFPGDRSMSGTHSCIEVFEHDLSVRVSDWGSKNGTMVERTLLRTAEAWHELSDGEILRLGSTLLILRYEPTQPDDAAIPTLVGVSLLMRDLRARIAKLAAEDETYLLIQGETGTGKEVVARALHELGPRRGRSFVAVNCSAIPDSLAESELFGHTEGAFTGARARLGHFRSAHRGTLFLDEVGDMPLGLQPKLFRALQERVVHPVGADRPESCDVRVLSATNQDLRADIDAGEFRPELYRRLARNRIELPPLRSRREDILPLLRHHYAAIGDHLDVELIHDMLLYPWPENVGELGNIADQIRIEGVSATLRAQFKPHQSASASATALLPADSASAPALPPAIPSPRPASRPTRRLTPPTREQLEELMQRHAGIVLRVAEELDCSRRQVQRWLAQYDLRAETFRR